MPDFDNMPVLLCLILNKFFICSIYSVDVFVVQMMFIKQMFWLAQFTFVIFLCI